MSRPCYIVGWVFERQKEYVEALLTCTNVERVTVMDQAVMSYTETREERRPSHAVSLLILNSLHILFVCFILAYLQLAEGKDSQ